LSRYRATIRAVRRAVLSVAVCSLLVASSAFARGAASPPAGRYACVVTANAGTAGTLFIVDASHYRLNKGKAAVYAASGLKLTFTSGPFHGVYRARWSVTKTTRAEIVFTSLRNGARAQVCSWKGKK
jgi:hypothetical protein